MAKSTTTINYTRTLLRFLKNHDGYYDFTRGIRNCDRGRDLYNTFYGVKYDLKTKKDKQERYQNDPIGWILAHCKNNAEKMSFLRDMLNIHLVWEKTSKGTYFWKPLHFKWMDYVNSNFQKEFLDPSFLTHSYRLQLKKEKKISKWNKVKKFADTYWYEIALVMFAIFSTMTMATLIIAHI